MLRTFLFRAVLVAIPFVVWFIWRAWAVRNGREMGATPWAWLTAAGAVLAAASLLISPLFHDAHRNAHYVPAEARPDGSVVPGHFEQKAQPR
ncbi:MAG TPA: DUF6111 family protein [Phenylobacterium sp.]